MAICKKVVLENGVRFDFVNGKSIETDVRDLPREIVERLAIHGLSQKVGDSYAGAESVDEAIGNAKMTYDNLVANVWAVKAIRGGKIVEAIVRATGQAFDVVLAKWAIMTDEEKKAVKSHPDVKKALAEIEAERAAALAKAAGDSAPLEF